MRRPLDAEEAIRRLLRRLRGPFRCAQCGGRVIIGLSAEARFYEADLSPHICRGPARLPRIGASAVVAPSRIS